MLQYGKTVVTDAGTYSIDKLIIETWLPWPSFYDDKALLLTFQLMGWELMNQERYIFKDIPVDSKVWVWRRLKYHPPGTDSSLLVELLRRNRPLVLQHLERGEDGEATLTPKVFVPQPQYGVRIIFNPNKHWGAAVISRYFEWFAGLEEDKLAPAMWRLRRVDRAFDVPMPIMDVCMVSKKEASYIRGTRYFGQRSHTGNTRIYDKAKRERVEGLTLTRFEWEQWNEEPIYYDVPLIIGELPKGYSWVKYIRLEALNECLADMDVRTRKKIRERCFQKIPFDPSIWDRLLAEYLQELHLEERRHMMSVKEHLDAEQAELEKREVASMEEAFDKEENRLTPEEEEEP